MVAVLYRSRNVDFPKIAKQFQRSTVSDCKLFQVQLSQNLLCGEVPAPEVSMIDRDRRTKTNECGRSLQGHTNTIDGEKEVDEEG